MDLEILLNKSERQIPYDITYMQNLKYDTNELIYETNRLTDNGKQIHGYLRGKGMEKG